MLLVLIWIGIAVVKVPRSHEEVASDSHHMHFTATVRRLHHNHHWRYGVLAQFFNVGAQVCTWTYIVLYVAEVVPGGTAEQGAYYLLISLIIFLVARFGDDLVDGLHSGYQAYGHHGQHRHFALSLCRIRARDFRSLGAGREYRLAFR